MPDPQPDAPDQPSEQQKPSFEEALGRLEEIVDEIEEGKISLEASIEKYAEGTKLVAHCRSVLDAAEEKIRLLTRRSGGELTVEGELPEGEDRQDEQG